MFISDLFTVVGYLHTAGFKTAEELFVPSVYDSDKLADMRTTSPSTKGVEGSHINESILDNFHRS